MNGLEKLIAEQDNLNTWIEEKVKKLRDHQDFLDKVIKIHNNKYDYSKTNYINCRTKITIICPKHGEFEQLPNNHWQGAGYPKCKNELTSKICKYTTDKFINLI